jgi:cysteine-rich repeat protein
VLIGLPEHLDATTADDLCLPAANPCVVSTTVAVTTGSVIDVGPRELRIATGGALDVGNGTMTINAGQLTVQTNGFVRAAGSASTGGGSIIITAGSATITAPTAGAGALSADGSPGGNLTLTVSGALTVIGALGRSISAIALNQAVIGGTIQISAGTATIPGSVLAGGGIESVGGGITIDTAGSMDVTGMIDASGGDGGSVDLQAGLDLQPGNLMLGESSIVSADAGEAAGLGGTVVVAAKGPVGRGNVTMNGVLSAVGGGGGPGGRITVSADGDLRVGHGTARVSAQSGGPDGIGGEIRLSGTAAVEVRGNLLASAGEGVGGFVHIDSQSQVSIGGTVSVDGASEPSDGTMNGRIEVIGCSVALLAGENPGLLSSLGPRGVNRIAGRYATVLGTMRSNTINGRNELVGDGNPQRAPLIAGSVVPDPFILVNPSDLSCQACGNAVVEPPEVCDDEENLDGDGCDENCTATGCGNGATVGDEQCDDGNRLNDDGCEADCRFPPTAMPTITPTHSRTGTPTQTQTPSATASVTATTTMTSSATPDGPTATGTPIATPTAGVEPTHTERPPHTATTTATAAVSAVPTSALVTCLGDCNRNAMVLINELLVGVNVALGNAPLANCPSFDANGSEAVEINELVGAVQNALRGCPTPAMPTATPVPTPTATPRPPLASGVVEVRVFHSATDKLYYVIGVDVAAGSVGIGAQITSVAMSDGAVQATREPVALPDRVLTALAGAISGSVVPVARVRRTGVLAGLVSNDVVLDTLADPLNGEFDPLANNGDGLLTLPGGQRTVAYDGSGSEAVVDASTPSGSGVTFVPAAAPTLIRRQFRNNTLRAEALVFPNPAGAVVSSAGATCSPGNPVPCDPSDSSPTACGGFPCGDPGGEVPGQNVTVDDSYESRVGNPAAQGNQVDGFFLRGGSDVIVFLVDGAGGPPPVNAAAAGFLVTGACAGGPNDAAICTTDDDCLGDLCSDGVRGRTAFAAIGGDGILLMPPRAPTPSATFTNAPPPTSTVTSTSSPTPSPSTSPSPSASPTATSPTLVTVQQRIFSPKCTDAICHGDARMGDLWLEEGQSFSSLVGALPVNAFAGENGLLRVDPGDPDNSFLILKLAGPSDSRFGSRMPLASLPLSEEELQLVRAWIAGGALP